MPIIQFDVLVPHEFADRVGEIFSTACDKLVAVGKLTSATVVRDDEPQLYDGVEEGLRRSYRDEHDEMDLENASVRRYAIAVDGVEGSINQLTMVLSRFLTPEAVLPKDHVALENEQAHEQAAIFPWAVEIKR